MKIKVTGGFHVTSKALQVSPHVTSVYLQVSPHVTSRERINNLQMGTGDMKYTTPIYAI